MYNPKTLRFLFTAAILIGFSTAAFGQASRTWVSGLGDDANPCSRTAPCKTFAGAITRTAAFGEINVIDSGGFGALNIGKSLTVRAVGVQAGVIVSGTNGFIVNAGATDVVFIEGIDFEGLGASTTSLNGVQIVGGGVTRINNCRINGFPNGNGVNVAGIANANVIITNSRITNCGGGVNVAGFGGAANFATILDTVVDGNSSFALQVTGAADSATVAKSSLINSPTGIGLVSGGVAASFGPSNIVTGTGAFSFTIPFK